MAKLTSQQDDLATMVPLMGGEVGHEVDDVRWQIEPGNGRKAAVLIEGRPHESGDGLVAPLEGIEEPRGSHAVPIDLFRRLDLGALGEPLRPCASTIVDVAGDHAYGAPGSAWNLFRPELGGKVLEEKSGDPMVRLPTSEN